MRENETALMGKSSTRIAYISMLIALSAVGALIKIQGSIALDSMPGFFAALFLGPSSGALVAGIGHILSALTSGFPLSLPMHMIIALEMSLFALLFGIAYKRTNGVLASVLAIFLNGPAAAAITAAISIILGLPFNGWALFYAVVIPLTLASAVNVVLAYTVYSTLRRRIK